MKSIFTVFRGSSPGRAWGDEAWIASASFKLANHGALGSDLFLGLHDADQYYFLNLPVHHRSRFTASPATAADR